MRTLSELLRKRDKLQGEYEQYYYQLNDCDLTDDDLTLKMYIIENKLKRVNAAIKQAAWYELNI